jgi:phenylacetate-CoA ligase
MGYFEGIYKRLPVLLQHAMVSAYGLYWNRLRFGIGYRHYVNDYVNRERFSPEEWRDWQQEILKKVLAIAAEEVPFYRKTWSSLEKAEARAGNLNGLPLLDKESIRESPKAFLRQDIKPWPRLVFHTSGSTGTPIESIWTVQELRNSMALREVRSARWASVSFNLPRATFSGRLVEPNPESTGPYYRFNLTERQVYLSAFHLTPQAAPAYVEALRRHNVQWLTGYAVSFYLLARYILELGLVVPPLRALVTTSEKVTKEMRDVMEQAYGCRVFEEYSTVENVMFAHECDLGRLHVSPDAGIVEILGPDGSACEPGEPGEVVATGLIRSYQPFIRYRLGDIATWDEKPCSCGRKMPVIKEVLGRIEDVVVGPDGRQMVRFHGIFTAQPHVREGQIIQESLHRIRVKVVPVNGFAEADAEDIVQRVKQRLGTDVDVIVETVPQIPRTAAGKFRAVVSKLPR